MAKWVLILLGMTIGIECLGSIRRPIDVQMWKIELDIMNYWSQEGYLPTSLDALTQRPYGLKKEDLIDPWGKAIGYEYSGDENFVVWSLGPDKKKGTADDIIRGFSPSYAESWKAKNLPPVEAQGTNAFQAATGETAQPTAGVGKVTPKHVPVTSTQPPAETGEPAKTKTAPWKIPLLIVVAVVGVITVWRCFRKKNT